MRGFQALLALVFLAPLVSPLPIVHESPNSDTGVGTRSFLEPGTLLGRRYSVQNHGFASTPAQPSPRYFANHQVSRRRPMPFPKYLAERAVAVHARAEEHSDVNYVSYVGAHPENVSPALSSDASTHGPSTDLDYNSSITLVPRPTATTHAHAKQAEATAKHVKVKSTHKTAS